MKFFSSIVFLFFSATIFLNAQTYFPEDSCVWHYEIVDVDGSIYPVSYTTGGDTLINSLLYKLARPNNTPFDTYCYRTDSNGNVYTRLVDPALWSCTDTNELLTYSFNSQVGDSLIIKTCYGDSALCILTLIDSVLTNHGNKKRMTFDLPNDTWPTCFTDQQMVWVEGIGSMNDLFYNLHFPNPSNVCLAQYNFLSVDSFGSNIHFSTLSDNDIASSLSKIWVSDHYTVHSEDMIKSVFIFDLYGRCIFGQGNIDRKEYELLPFQNYFDGIYIIKVFTAAGFTNFIVFKSHRSVEF